MYAPTDDEDSEFQLTITCSLNTVRSIRFSSLASMFWSRFVTCSTTGLLQGTLLDRDPFAPSFEDEMGWK